jgi:tight adherence protein C
MKILFVILVFISAAALTGSLAVIIYRQRTLKLLQGVAAINLINRIKESIVFVREHIIKLNRKFTSAKRYAQAADMLSKLNMADKITVEYFAFIEESAVLITLLLCLLLIGDPLLSVVFAAAAFFAPYFLLKSGVERKKDGILKEMPDAFDIIAANIEGGLSLNMAMNRYVVKSKSGFGAELLTALKKVQLGKSFEAALEEMDERLGIRELTSFINAFVQAEKMGGNIKEIIKNQSEEIRKKRFQYLKKKAHEAPVKLLIPLLLFIFPVIFIVLFGPIVIKLMQGL